MAGWAPRPAHTKSSDMESSAAKAEEAGGVMTKGEDLSACPHVAPRGHVNGDDRDRDEDRTLPPAHDHEPAQPHARIPVAPAGRAWRGLPLWPSSAAPRARGALPCVPAVILVCLPLRSGWLDHRARIGFFRFRNRLVKTGGMRL
jgi:hypothetical protein